MMSFNRDRLRVSLKFILQKVGLLPAARQFRRFIRVLIKPKHDRCEIVHDRCEPAHYQRFLQFKQQYEDVLRHNLNGAGHEQKKVLVVSMGFPEVEMELGLIKALELAGFTPVVLIPYEAPLLPEYYNLVSIKEIYFLLEHLHKEDDSFVF